MRRILIPLAILALLLVGLYVGYSQFTAGAASAPAYQTATVQRGTLVALVNAAGAIQANAQTSLAFQTSGQVVEVNVAPGDHVTRGQVLMRLDATELQMAVEEAEIALETAQINLERTKAGPTKEQLDSAQAALDSAQARLEQVKAGPTKQQLASAQAALDSAQANLERLLKGPDPHDVRIAELNVENARNSLWQAQAQRDADAGKPTTPDWQLDLDEARINSAQNQLEIALQNLEAAKAGPTEDQIAAARAQVVQAQANLETLKNSPTSYDLIQAEAAVRQAQANLETLKNSPTRYDIAQAEAQVRQAQLALQQAQNRLKDAVITAPYDGIVAAVSYRVGDQASPNTAAVTLVDLSALSIQVTLSEVDVPKVQVNQPVNVTLDALPDLSLAGYVSYISPVGAVQQGVVNYPVTILLDNPGGAVKPGMTANVAITVDRRDNVLLVPNRAVRTQGGQRVVQVLYQGQPVPVPVQLGLSNDTATEVLSGLQEGDQVVLNTTTQTVGGFGGLGGPVFITR